MAVQAGRIHYLDSIRGIAAMMVVVYHFWGWFWADRMSFKLGAFLFNGSDAVSFFFVLSGFVLSYSYLHTDRKINFLRYLWKRILRLYPAYIFTVMLIFTYWHRDSLSLASYSNAIFQNEGKLMTELTMILHQHKFYIPGWTLGVEMIYSLLVPLLIVFVRIKKEIFIPLVIASIFVGPAHLRIFMIHFCLGVLFALYYPRITQLEFSKTKLYPYRYLLYLLTLVLFSTRCFERLLPKFQEIYPKLFAMGFDHFHLSGIASFFILVFVAMNKKVQQFLEKSIFLFIGKISYSIYLIHWLLVIFIMNNWDYWAQFLGFGKWRFFIMLSLFILATIGCAALMYRFIEQPFIRWSKKKF